MARYRDEEYYDDYDRRPRFTRASNAPAWTMAMIMLIGVVVFGVWLAPDLLPSGPSIIFATQPAGAIGNQAPPAAVRRLPAPAAAPRPAVQQQPAAIPGVAQNEATAQAQYDAAVQAGESAPVATPQPLPLNSAGEPIISQAQADQQALSLALAEQEAAAAADAQLRAAREAANAEQLARPPDVSYQEAVDLLHRDPCHVPRANPATCAQGLYKPTPVNAP